MKTALDPRHQKRIDLMQHIFAYSFRTEDQAEDITPIVAHLTTIDQSIEKAAPEWPVDKIAKIDLAILRLAIFELTFEKNQPVKVVIDEAVELAKEFGNPNSGKFINGVLGTIVKTLPA